MVKLVLKYSGTRDSSTVTALINTPKLTVDGDTSLATPPLAPPGSGAVLSGESGKTTTDPTNVALEITPKAINRATKPLLTGAPGSTGTMTVETGSKVPSLPGSPAPTVHVMTTTPAAAAPGTAVKTPYSCHRKMTYAATEETVTVPLMVSLEVIPLCSTVKM